MFPRGSPRTAAGRGLPCRLASNQSELFELEFEELLEDEFELKLDEEFELELEDEFELEFEDEFELELLELLALELKLEFELEVQRPLPLRNLKRVSKIRSKKLLSATRTRSVWARASAGGSGPNAGAAVGAAA